jgi:hypothetical protein
MPILEELFDSIRDSNIFTIVDLKQSFNQIMFVMKDCKKTTFHGSNKLWEWLVMLFRMKNLLSTSHGLGSRRGNFLKCYIDDVLVHSKGLM